VSLPEPIQSLEDDRSAVVEQELQNFSYIVSHDLAASLRHMSEFSRLLVGDLGEGLTERQRAYAERISEAHEKCQLMMEQLLAFSRLQQKPLERVRQDATPAMQFAALKLDGALKITRAELSIEPLGEAYADQVLLGQVLHHLLDNAVKFHKPEVPPRIRVEPAHDAWFWRVRFTDNGLGVEPPYRDKVFWMFQRLHPESAYAGVGAGLAICRRVARRHGGEVAFLDCDDGACVELSLPRDAISP
jgi:light-regulated signal transduction histidine kinase (bacteriophytochrome)